VLSKLSENNMTRKYALDQTTRNIFLINLYQTNKLKIELIQERKDENLPSVNATEDSRAFFKGLNALQ